MTTHIQDQILDRREITSALVRALERRHEVLDAVVDSKDHQEALTTVAETPRHVGSKCRSSSEPQVQRTDQGSARSHPGRAGESRRHSRMDDARSSREQRAELHPASVQRQRRRQGTVHDSLGRAARRRRQVVERGSDRSRARRRSRSDRRRERCLVRRAEDVSGDGPKSVGLVFGELDGQEVNVAIWIAPESRKKGYGTACVKHSRRELAAEFPGTVLVVRAPA